MQNNFLRLVGNYPRFTLVKKIHEELKIETIEALVRRLTRNFFIRTESSRNVLLEILNYENKKYKHKRIKHILFN